MPDFFDTGTEYLKGAGPARAELLRKELQIFTFDDLITYYPFRYEDRTQFHKIANITGDMPGVQFRAKLRTLATAGVGRKKRLVGRFADETGEIEAVWFQGVSWLVKSLQIGVAYIVFGKPNLYKGKLNIPHPETDPFEGETTLKGSIRPVYHITESLRRRNLHSGVLQKLQKNLAEAAEPHISENLPSYIIKKQQLVDRKTALKNIHFPENHDMINLARQRLKFEELFYIQITLFQQKGQRKEAFPGQIFGKIPTVKLFYETYLPFELTGAQKRVIREIYDDLRSGKQMNRLLQGDVGSGKTITAFVSMLAVVDGGAQTCLMAPTEILAEQHFRGLKKFADVLGISVGLLTGSTKSGARKILAEQLATGELKILVGTHALIEASVQFQNLGLCVIDEQHRFGVAQRAKLAQKNSAKNPHILVMTATPIPRTLAMTLYGDLDLSVIAELPAGRKPIKTVHRFDSARLKVFGFLKEQITAGRQVYIVYPLIEESEKSDLKDLTDGYESICKAFPNTPIGILHGKMKPADKDTEMQRFVKGITKIMVATTVIEVGVDVPNATVMIVENAERFGLSQLHQLRGRVGRGAEQSYCILMSDYKLSKEAKVRLRTMVQTNNGFEIADTDLKLRGPGDLSGTQQSGILNLKIADLGKDGLLLQEARRIAQAVIEADPHLEAEKHAPIRRELNTRSKKSSVNWSLVS